MSEEQGSESAVSRSQFIKEEKVAEEKEAPKKVSRREFVKGAAAVASVGALASCAPAATPGPGETAAPAATCPPAGECAPAATPWIPEKWDYEADVVVVGFGGGGAAAAITANDAGAKVILLEKMVDGLEGGNTSAAGGSATAHQDVAEFAAYQKELQRGFDMPEEWIEPWCEALKENKPWLEEMAPAYVYDAESGVEYPELPAAIAMGGVRGVMTPPSGDYVSTSIEPPYGKGRYLMGQLRARIDERGIEVLYSTPMKELLQDPVTKEILGVKAVTGVTFAQWSPETSSSYTGGEEIYIKANKGVILACGGFENNYRMKQNYLPNPDIGGPPGYTGGGTPGNTGDGIRAAMTVGAELWHMNYASMSSLYPIFPDYPLEAGVAPRLDSGGFSEQSIWVNKYGKRFTAVKGGRHGKCWTGEVLWYDGEKEEFPNTPVTLIFDEATRVERSIFRYSWWVYRSGTILSADNSAEVEKGWIKKGDTIEELAAALELPPAALKDTLEKYNEYVAAGEDPEFHQEIASGAFEALGDPPYYGIKAWMGFSGTEGGPRRNPDCQILDHDDQPIPRLYGVGEMGSYLAWQYQGGTNVGETLATGRTAARHAVGLEPWA